MPKEYENVVYRGAGPYENYDDRKCSSIIKEYNQKIRDLHVPYIYPEENGNRCDTNWLNICNN